MKNLFTAILYLCLIGVLGTFFAMPAHGQFVGFKTDTSYVTEPKEGSKSHLVELNFLTQDTIAVNVEIEVQLGSTAIIDRDFTLITKKVLLSNEVPNGVIQLNINADSTFEKEEIIILTIKKSDSYNIRESNSRHVVKIKDGLTVPSEVPYSTSLSIGANFDFLNGTHVDHLYYDLNVFIPKVWNVFNSGAPMGLEAGMTQNRSLSVDSTGVQRYGIGTSATDENGEETFTGAVYSYSATTQVDNLALYLSPFIVTAHDYGTNAFAVLTHFELLRRSYLTDLEQTDVWTDTTIALPYNNFDTVRNLPPESKRKVITQGNFGVGLMFYHLSEDIKLRIKGIIGISSFNSYVSDFYLVSFDLTERNNLIRLGGEIRGVLSNTDQKIYKQPYVNIYLAKQFPLKKLTDLFAGK